MTINTSDELRRLYQSPILSRPNFTNQYRDFNSNKYNFSRDNFRDYNRFDYNRDLSKEYGKFDNLRDNYKDYNRYDFLKDGSLNYNTNMDYFDNTYNKYSTSYDNFKDYNYNKYNFTRDNYKDCGRDYSYSHLNNYKNYNNLNQHCPESSFVMPNYLKSFERFTPNRYSNFQTPNKYNGLSSPNRYNLLNNNKYSTSFNKDLNKDLSKDFSKLDNLRDNLTRDDYRDYNRDYNRDYSYSHLNNYKDYNRDDWDNYHNISNSPNLKFKTQFYPHNKYSFTRDTFRDNFCKDYNRDDFNYSHHHHNLYTDYSRDNLFKNNYYDMKDLKDNMKFVYNRDKLEKIKNNLNTVNNLNSVTSNPLNSSFNFQPLEDNNKFSYLHRDRRELDRRSPLPSRYRSRSVCNSEELDIDEVYRKLKEQKKQLQSLKANLN